jgi:NAD(P)H-hydrate epimerase
MGSDPCATREEVRAFDRYCIETLGLPGIALMENAGRQITDAAREMLSGTRDPRVLIVAGRGNNGGDGFVVARHLAIAGIAAEVVLVAPREKVAGDAAINLAVLEAMGLPVAVADGDARAVLAVLRQRIAAATLVVDALLGTGTQGGIREPYASVIEAINAAGRPVLAVDIPSGMDADTGAPLGPTIRAAVTVTMAARKTGFDAPGAAAYTGKVRVADIGVPFGG